MWTQSLGAWGQGFGNKEGDAHCGAGLTRRWTQKFLQDLISQFCQAKISKLVCC